MRQQQQSIQMMLQLMANQSGESPMVLLVGVQLLQAEVESGASSAPTPNHEIRLARNIDSHIPGNSVSWLATQIPEYSGSDKENVSTWVKRVDQVAGVHGASDGVTLLAASSKLTKLAKTWYEVQTGAAVESWIGLRTEMLKIFERKVPFYESIQRAELREWIPAKETFDEYAIAKLAIIHQLNLPVRNTIHLLISDIANNAIRTSALLVADSTLESFLDKMRAVTEGCSDVSDKKSVSPGAKKSKDDACRNCGKKGHSHKECRNEVTCFYCKQKGHRAFDCPSVKAKNAKTPHQQSQRAISTAAPVTEVETEEEVVALVNERDSLVKIYDPLRKVETICNRECNLRAILDMGSPVSFVKYNVYVKWILPFVGKLVSSKRVFVNLQRNPLNVIGVVPVELTIDFLKNKRTLVNLFVIKDNAFDSDLILGREFIRQQGLTLCCPSHNEASIEPKRRET